MLYQLQYRKRYELLQLSEDFIKEFQDKGYNTASGMSCCNMVSLRPEYWSSHRPRYNTASGMNCCNNGNCGLHIHISRLQYRKRYELLQLPVWLQ